MATASQEAGARTPVELAPPRASMFVAASDAANGSVMVAPSAHQSWSVCAHGAFSVEEFTGRVDNLLADHDKGAIWARVGEDSSRLAEDHLALLVHWSQGS